MTFTELVEQVYVLTNRRDRVAETESAVSSATLEAHNTDFFAKDIWENGIDFGVSEFFLQLDYREINPRWRAAKYLRKYDAVGQTAGKFLKLITPENVLDGYSYNKVDVYYIAGAHLNVRSSTKEQYFLMGCYQHPNIVKATYDSWIAVDHPYAIIYRAAASVLSAVGKTEDAAAYLKLSAKLIFDIQISNVQTEGY